jgi:uncharacterized membrane protein YphA (DoxX/SURF4 family)
MSSVRFKDGGRSSRPSSRKDPVHSAIVFWSSVAGIVFLILGLIVVRKDFGTAHGLENLIVLGPVFVAAPLAAFAAEHLTLGRLMAGMVPAWMPARVFWIYFVGVALLAAALSLDLKRYVRWSAPLLALLFLLFVLTIHLPNAVGQPKNRIFWVLVFRETSFTAGALALTAATLREHRAQLSETLTTVARIVFAIVLLFFGLENILHPECAPGVPLEKLTPAWVPLPHLWAYLVGILLLAAGGFLLLNRKTRLVGALTGLLIVVLTVFLYVPILATDRGTAQLIEGINYVADTLLFAGTALLVAMAMRTDRT